MKQSIVLGLLLGSLSLSQAAQLEREQRPPSLKGQSHSKSFSHSDSKLKSKENPDDSPSTPSPTHEKNKESKEHKESEQVDSHAQKENGGLSQLKGESKEINKTIKNQSIAQVEAGKKQQKLSQTKAKTKKSKKSGSKLSQEDQALVDAVTGEAEAATGADLSAADTSITNPLNQPVPDPMAQGTSSGMDTSCQTSEQPAFPSQGMPSQVLGGGGAGLPPSSYPGQTGGDQSCSTSTDPSQSYLPDASSSQLGGQGSYPRGRQGQGNFIGGGQQQQQQQYPSFQGEGKATIADTMNGYNPNQNQGKGHGEQRLNQAASILKMDELNSLYDIFQLADVSGDRQVSQEELIKAYNIDPLDQEKIRYMMETMDSDKNGIIDFAEFVNWGATPEAQVLNQIEQTRGIPLEAILTPGMPLPSDCERKKVMQNANNQGLGGGSAGFQQQQQQQQPFNRNQRGMPNQNQATGLNQYMPSPPTAGFPSQQQNILGGGPQNAGDCSAQDGFNQDFQGFGTGNGMNQRRQQQPQGGFPSQGFNGGANQGQQFGAGQGVGQQRQQQQSCGASQNVQGQQQQFGNQSGFNGQQQQQNGFNQAPGFQGQSQFDQLAPSQPGFDSFGSDPFASQFPGQNSPNLGTGGSQNFPSNQLPSQGLQPGQRFNGNSGYQRAPIAGRKIKTAKKCNKGARLGGVQQALGANMGANLGVSQGQNLGANIGQSVGGSGCAAQPPMDQALGGSFI